MTDTSKQRLQKVRGQLLECKADVDEAKRILDRVEIALEWVTRRRAVAIEAFQAASDPETQKITGARLHAIDECYTPLIVALYSEDKMDRP